MLKKLPALLLLGVFPLSLHAAEAWQEVKLPTVAETAKAFPEPPKEFRAIQWAIWGGTQTKERILADIARVDANGGGVYMINNSRGLTPKYLSPEYMDLVKAAVEECKKRGMKVWIEDEGGYPDGFAGGIISRDYPQLGMQGIVADAHYTVAGGQTLTMPLPADTLGIIATQRAAAAAVDPVPSPNVIVPVAAPAAGAGNPGGRGRGGAGGGAATPPPAAQDLPLPADGHFKWTAPAGGTWEVDFQGSVGEARYTVVPGQTLSIPLPPETKTIHAATRGGGARGGGGAARGGAVAANPPTLIPIPADGQFKWTAPANGTWEITFVRHLYRSSPTRYSNRADGTSDKDSLYSLIDYLDPAATQVYLKSVHETYEKLFGDEFGKTIMGFRGDEPDYTGFIPWSPKLLEEFQARKGYDLKPYIAQFFTTQISAEAQRAKADYWDVWSALFRDNFFKPQEEWCNARHMEYMLHLNHEEIMINPRGGEGMISNEGSFFRDMRYAGIPGIDNLNQIGPGIVADFPKLAASAAHVFGRPMVWAEEGGGVGAAGKFVTDYQLVRGVNYLNIRGLTGAAGGPGGGGAAAAPLPAGAAAATGWYVSRAGYLLATGRPAAQIALFHPTDSMWLNDQQSDTDTVKLTTDLMEHQIDFDHIDADSLASICTLENGGIKNLSGQVYRGVVVPTSTVIQKSVLDRLRAFAAAGGKVVFVGRTPTMVVDKTFLHPEPGAPDLSFATLEPTASITPKVIAALPKPDVALDSPCPPLKYIHRSLKDGDVYFFFNEAADTQTRTATLNGTGQVQIWDPTTGAIRALPNVPQAKGTASIPLTLESHESRFIVIAAQPIAP